MKAIWKEFFRLKWEEISDWFAAEWPWFIGVPYVVYGYVMIFARESINYNPWFFTIYLIPFWIIIAAFIVGTPIGIIYGIYSVIKWIHSNWKQAKENVEEEK